MLFCGNSSRSLSSLRRSSPESKLHSWEKLTLFFFFFSSEKTAELYYFLYCLPLLSSFAFLYSSSYKDILLCYPSQFPQWLLCPSACLKPLLHHLKHSSTPPCSHWEYCGNSHPSQSSEDCLGFSAWEENWDLKAGETEMFAEPVGGNSQFQPLQLPGAHCFALYIFYPSLSESQRKLSVSKHETQ